MSSNDPNVNNVTPPSESSVQDLRVESENLKAKIEDARKASAMPVDSALGDPNWENKAADGRFDRSEDDDE